MFARSPCFVLLCAVGEQTARIRSAVVMTDYRGVAVLFELAAGGHQEQETVMNLTIDDRRRQPRRALFSASTTLTSAARSTPDCSMVAYKQKRGEAMAMDPPIMGQDRTCQGLRGGIRVGE
ncbi:hypothetical protein SVAN01_02551 [Stagonosporopsis vannaccii]|nr:hypothetical protein SVAN01_02551 [Stagonosporopsis vannaccii]